MRGLSPLSATQMLTV
uniref:Uncharacterized protein n=1 Tax=Anguilla anguilla TaxID=7936 RepID=A0A0E9VGL8_ANGAN